mgnify:CR=1 FL=1
MRWSRLSKHLFTEIDEIMEDQNKGQDLSELFIALSKVHDETKDIHADSVNPFHKSKYASLSAHLSYLKPIFSKHGLVVIQLPCSEYHDNGIGIKTIIAHKNGSSIQTTCIVPVGEQATGQQAGAILTYLRRYCLASIGGLATTDDDCESDREVKTVSAPVKKSAPVSAPAAKASASSSGEPDFSLQVPFGNNKGTSLQDLADKDLDYWANKWEPRPFEKTGKVTARDSLLKKSAKALWALKNGGEENEQQSEDEIPF